LMEASAATGLVANTDRDGAAWVAWRVEQRHLPERSHIQRLHCGRWLLVNERRTASGQTVGIYTDITELKRGEQALRAATVEAEQATRTKSEFLANMSHELRTPLNAIIGFSDTILAEIFGPIGNPRYREYLGHIHHSGHHLLDLINDILDLSKVEAGKVELEYLPIDVAVLVEGCLTMLGERASAVGLTLSARIEDEPLILWGDERRLRQVLINLLSNAIKFTPEGGSVTVHAAARPEGMVALTVADSGIGIAAEDIAKVLEPFGQVESAQSRKHQGTGLGLPLARNLVQLHGGTFHLSSQPGEGTTIVLTLPAAGHKARQAVGSAPGPSREARDSGRLGH
ncbi:MAG: two-component sensor histidine kinase, partial [Rhodospirillales bacterium]|nr:two-component sensor histidine kinase [Rhodospirillales bacterium]